MAGAQDGLLPGSPREWPEPHSGFFRLCSPHPQGSTPTQVSVPRPRPPPQSFLAGRAAVGRALPRFHAIPGLRVGGLPADESWLHLSCHKTFSSSKYGSAGSKWNSELITNGLKSQSHLKNSHIQPARNQGTHAVAPSQTRGGAVGGLRGPKTGETSPAAHTPPDLGPATIPSCASVSPL